MKRENRLNIAILLDYLQPLNLKQTYCSGIFRGFKMKKLISIWAVLAQTQNFN